MQIEYHKWYSSRLGRDMELKVYGWYGKPMVVFPAQGGRFWDWEDFGMTNACQAFIESGKIKVFTVDSVDKESWANWNAHPADRAIRHEQYDQYITQEVVPFIRHHCNFASEKFISTGVSMGGYHSSNFFFRHPDVFDTVISLSGLHRLNHFIGDYMDDNVYYNSPIYYLPNMTDNYYLDLYRQSKIILCCGKGAWEEEMIADAHQMQQVLDSKNIPAWVDFWGNDVNHDWPWWRQMLPYFLEKLDLKGPA